MDLQLNGVKLNVRTAFLALVLLAGVAVAADVGYRLFSDGAADMTLPAVSRPPAGGAGDIEPPRPADLPP
ncbi:MAG: hypothetical protein AB7U20_00565 [Planctomycetaceae bacterium]